MCLTPGGSNIQCPGKISFMAHTIQISCSISFSFAAALYTEDLKHIII